MDWTPDLPAPASEDWRVAFGYQKESRLYYPSGAPAETTYQAPKQSPVPFIYDSMKLSSGLSVDTAEYPFFGLWSSIPLNEKPQSITVSGFLRGNEYIKNRNALAESLRMVTTDEEPGFLSLPLWGRFPVIVIDWDIEENAKELGQCKVNLTFVRAGLPVEKRWEQQGELGTSISEAAEAVKVSATNNFEKKLSFFTDNETLKKSFSLIQKSLIDIVGRIQGSQKTLNDITNAVGSIGTLLAQGVRAPKTLALALFAATGKIAISLAEIKNAGEETVSFFRIKNNEKNSAFCFLTNDVYTLPVESVTVKQKATKTATEQLYRAASFYAASAILPDINGLTYNQVQNLFLLYRRLENSIDLNNPELYKAVNELRAAVSRTLAVKRLSQELLVEVSSVMPLLTLAHYLGTEEAVLRKLNRIEDSFVMKGDVRYV